MINKKIVNGTVHIFGIIAPAVIFHLLFSKYGFNLTDEGFTLAYSRRLIEGQIPHLDFIIIRPFISPLIHIPEVLIGGEYTFLLSRQLVWLQMSVTTYFFVEILSNYFGNILNNIQKHLIFLIALVMSVNSLFVLAWHTIDSLFFISFGLYVVIKNRKNSIKYLGYFLMGLSYCCKQSFIFIIPIAFILFRNDRSVKMITAIIMPMILYFIYLVINNAFNDAILQMFSQKDLYGNGIYRYIYNLSLLWGVILGYLILVVLKKTLNRISYRKVMFVLIVLSINIPGFFFIRYLLRGTFKDNFAFLLLGLMLGHIIYLIIEGNGSVKEKLIINAGLLTASISWMVSLSLGSNDPLLMLGIIFTMLFLIYKDIFFEQLNNFIISGTLILLVIGFVGIRLNLIHFEKPASELNSVIDDIIYGTKGIQTNSNMREYLLALREAVSIAEKENTNYAIIPDISCYWVKSKKLNPMPIDWMYGIELNSYDLIKRIEEVILDSNKVNYIVSKTSVFDLSKGFYGIEHNRYPILRFIENNLNVVFENNHFRIYRSYNSEMKFELQNIK